MSQIEPMVPLDPLDPGRDDPTYWVRFHKTVMDAARPHLERRRKQLTVGGALLSWSRMTVPVAAMVAALAALILMQEVSQGEAPEVLAGIEDLLVAPDAEVEPLPVFLRTDEVVDRDLVLFTVEAY